MISRFPPIHQDTDAETEDNLNPAIRLFGRRFFADQTILELLIELLLVASSEKRIEDSSDFSTVFPDRNVLKNWPQNKRLQYAPPIRLNLKLFSFIGSSKLETRHEIHKRHYRHILHNLRNAVEAGRNDDKDDVLRTLEHLFLGFQGIGQNRTWCAQAFLPICPELLAGESIWEETRAKKREFAQWRDALSHFSHSRHDFMARGGEVLYLQLCNALRQSRESIRGFADELGTLAETEIDPERLYDELTEEFSNIIKQCPRAMGDLARFIDQIDGETDRQGQSDLRFATCAWCPESSWKEAYLFAVEFLRVCRAELGPIERLEMLMLCCAFQVLRSLCAQSARVQHWEESRLNQGNNLRYAWVISDPSGTDRATKLASQRNVLAVRELIHGAIRAFNNQENPERKVDSGYGDKFFLSLAKKLDFVVPRTGPGARFVLSDHIVRYLVLALIRPGERCTLDTFKERLFAHYGLAIDGEYIRRALIWSGYPALSETATNSEPWLVEMLRASGFLIHLSDACSLVENPFGRTEGTFA